MLETLPRTNCTSLDTRADTCRGALRTATRSASSPCLARIPSSLASQRGVPEADMPEYATLICSAFADEANSAMARIIHELLANMVIYPPRCQRPQEGHNSWAGALGVCDCEAASRPTGLYDFKVLLKWSMVRCQASFAASGS